VMLDDRRQQRVRADATGEHGGSHDL
jgi:hypothetical protein